MNNNTKNIMKIMFFPILILYYETILKSFTYETVFNIGYVYMCFFSLPLGLIFYLFSTVFKEKINKIIFFTIISFLSLYYGTQIVYYRIFYTFTTFYSIIGAGKALAFTDIVFTALFSNIPELITVFLPLILLAIFHKKIEFTKTLKKHILKIVLFAALIQSAIVSIVLSSDTGMLSPSYLYTETFLVVDSVDTFGLLTTGRLDIKNILKNMVLAAESEPAETIESEETAEEQVIIPVGPEAEEPSVREIEYNKMDIDFEDLIKSEGNEKIRNMHEYFSNIQPTKKNRYTGKYKNKNLILITAEGFSPYAINKDLTPTLYKMYEEGFKFKNFYTPLWGVSTSDGEYVACTGLLPKEGIWSFYKSSENYMPFAMGNQFKKVGYETKAYHNHYFDYYFRHKSHPNLGYTYKGLGNGLDVTETWPESDLEMIELTVPEYIDIKPFHVYYMTVSGHLQYNFSGNYMAAKNRDLVENLPYSENVKAYLACNIELEKAIEKLILELEKKGIAEDTLIAISPDHYPYGLTLSEMNELAGKEIIDYDLYKGVFLLWSKGMEPVEIDKVCSSLDIIPTLSNLVGLEYDSRLLMGRDILSDSEPLVVFSDRSWITDKAFFNAKTGEITLYKDEMDNSYIEEIEKTVKAKFKYSALILETDYYNIIFK